MDRKAQRRFQRQAVLVSGIVTFAALMCLFLIKGLAPFGTKSLVVMDANIQYLDFFSYLKDVLSGSNSVGYTFGKTLGGNNLAVFSYYLSSPFNLLILFFEKSQLHAFFDITAALKLSAASMTFAYFCTKRFEAGQNDALAVYILTAIGYGLCQYNIAQSSNIMWLDGVYMLPLILLQASNLARGRRAGALPFVVGAAIVFNWYAAGIDCVFSAVWFLFEYKLHRIDAGEAAGPFRQRAFSYIKSMLLGVMMSAALFLPTIGALRKGNRGALNFSGLIDFSLLGDVTNVIQKYSYGAASGLGSAALFCGSLSIVLALSAFFNREISKEKRKLFAVLFLVVLLAFYWTPLFSIFSLFSSVSSYHYRYSYIGIFTILFLAVLGSREVKRQHMRQVLAAAAAWAVLQSVLFCFRPVQGLKYVYQSAGAAVLAAVVFLLFSFAKIKSAYVRKIALTAVVLLGTADMAVNAYYLMDRYSDDNVCSYQAYRKAQEETISGIKSNDGSFYRISQTTTRTMYPSGLTANYNEAIAYNYASISGYTSSPDANQRNFLDNLGYPINGDNMCITNTSILGADSLLGVKYVLSPYAVNGLIETGRKDKNGKSVFLNPYACPVAFTYAAAGHEGNAAAEEAANPFEYQNRIYKEIFGIEEDLYSPVKYSISRNKDNYGAKIQLDTQNTANNALYGSIPWKNDRTNTSIYINGEFITKYACWLSPSVFYIPNTKDSLVVDVQTNADNFDWDAVQFYALNLDVLRKCADWAQSHKADDISVQNGSAAIRAKKNGANRLLLSIPGDSGWDITVNGEQAEVELVGGCLYSIKLPDEVNDISMQYHVQYLKAGIALSLCTILWCCFSCLRSRGGRAVQPQ